MEYTWLSISTRISTGPWRCRRRVLQGCGQCGAPDCTTRLRTRGCRLEWSCSLCCLLSCSRETLFWNKWWRSKRRKKTNMRGRWLARREWRLRIMKSRWGARYGARERECNVMRKDIQSSNGEELGRTRSWACGKRWRENWGGEHVGMMTAIAMSIRKCSIIQMLLLYIYISINIIAVVN